MAYHPTEEKYGYEDSRFESHVDENFHCSICLNVLKDPRMCKHNEHMFCFACIAQHLKVNSQTCPECNEHLSVDTLLRPRVVNKILSKLKINCDYARRGCPELSSLEELETHVQNCGYAPVLCTNAECGIVINKQEKIHHESEVCEYRKVKCHDCGQIQEAVTRLEGNLVKLTGKVEAAREVDDELIRQVGILSQMNMDANRKLKAVMQIGKGVSEVATEERQKQIGKVLKALNEKQELGMLAMYEKFEVAREESNKEIMDVKHEVKEIKNNLCKVNRDVNEMNEKMNQMLKMFQVLNKPTSPTEGMLYAPREDILISGGYGWSEAGISTEIFSWEKNAWYEVSSMNEDRVGASSFIHESQLFVVGGWRNNTLEALDLNESPLTWARCIYELPYKCDDHQTVVCREQVFHIGGYNGNENQRSNAISELQLTSPSILKVLCQMPEPRASHGAEVFEDTVLILGGYTFNHTTDSVLVFDPESNECEEMPELPYALERMGTVCWKDQLIVLGGCDNDGQVRNDVFMYNCKSGKITFLPSMLQKRRECCAVVTGNTIVVMGGSNKQEDCLSSVECFTMGSSAWMYLPNMNRERCSAAAEVLPLKRKFV